MISNIGKESNSRMRAKKTMAQDFMWKISLDIKKTMNLPMIKKIPLSRVTNA